MSYTLVLTPRAKKDIQAAAFYYRSIAPILSKQFLVRIREAREFITKYPLSLQIKHNNIRLFLLKQFPYHIHYVLDDVNMQIVILAVLHAYKNPKDYPTL